MPSSSPTQMQLYFAGIEDVYSYDKGEIDIGWDVPYYDGNVADLEGVVTYHIFIALGLFNYSSTLMNQTVDQLILEFEGNGTFQYHSISGEIFDIELNSTFHGELHSLLVVAELNGLFSQNTANTEIEVSDTSPKLQEGVDIKGIFVPSEDLQITLDTVDSEDLLHDLSFAGSLQQEHLDLNVGDNIFGISSEVSNFFRRIIAVKHSADDLLLFSVVKIPLEEVFDELDLEASLPISRKSPGITTSSGRKLFFKAAWNWVKKGVNKVVDFLSKATKKVIGIIGKGLKFLESLVKGKFGENFTILDVKENFQEELVPDYVTLKGYFEFTCKLQVAVKISLKRVYGEVRLGADYEVGARLDFEASGSEKKEKTINLWTGVPQRYFLTIIEINVRPKVDLVAKVEASYEASAHIEAQYYGDSSAAVIADTSSSKKVSSDFKKPSFKQRKFSVDLKGEAELTSSVTIVLQAQIGLYDKLLSASTGVSIGFEFTAAGGLTLINQETPIVHIDKFDVNLELDIPLSASALWGKYPIAKTSIYKKSWPLLRLPSAEIRIKKDLFCELGGGENGNNVAALELGLSKNNADSIIKNKFVGDVAWYGEDIKAWDLLNRNSQHLTVSNKNVLSSISPLPVGKIYVALQQQFPPLIKRLHAIEFDKLVGDGDAVECLEAGSCSGDKFFDSLSADLSFDFNANVFLSEVLPNVYEPSTVYKFNDLMKALKQLQNSNKFSLWLGKNPFVRLTCIWP